MFLIFTRPGSTFWTSLVLLFLLGFGYLVYKLTKGFIGGYLKADIDERLKATFLLIHGLGSLLLALILPNNYLVEIDFFHGLYEENELWIAASIFTLLFTFLLILGTFFTLVTHKTIRSSKEEKL